LIAHLVLVHDVASRLAEKLSASFLNAKFDRSAVLFGAATHDLGKALDVDELVQSGKEHERHGFELLAGMGIDEGRARFVHTVSARLSF